MGGSIWAYRRQSSQGESSVDARANMAVKRWLGKMMTYLLLFWLVSKSGQQDSGSAFMVFLGLYIRVMTNSIRKGK